MATVGQRQAAFSSFLPYADFSELSFVHLCTIGRQQHNWTGEQGMNLRVN